MRSLRVTAFLLFLCILLVSCSSQEPEPLLKLYVLDVGQGDCILLRTPEGDVLIDSGTELSQPLLCLRLKQLGVTALELMVLTHPDEDHIGGADGVLSEFFVKEVWTNGAAVEDACYEAFCRALSKSNAAHVTVRAGAQKELGGLSVFVLAPFEEQGVGGNAGSLILRLQFGSVSALLTGDADADAEESLLSVYGAAQLDCDVYKVGHHGSNTSSTKDFLEAMTPRYALISAGRGNPHGHPHGQVIARLREVGAEILRTDLLGELLLITDGTDVWTPEE